MTLLDSINLSPTVAALSWAVVHFLWQGSVIGLLAGAAFLALTRRSAQARYLVGCTAMALAIIMFLATFTMALQSGRTSAHPASTAEVIGVPPEPAFDLPVIGLRLKSAFDFQVIGPYLPGIAWLWLLGTCTMFAHMASQWMSARRLRCSSVYEVEDRWRVVFESLRRDLGAHPTVRLMQSAIAEVPMVIGWLSPLVLVPVAAFASLTPDQLRSILAHELAHIRRHDYLVNCSQKIVESVLFFHPVVWWLSSRIRLEREHCCDDVAVRTAGNALTFANALSRLEMLRAGHNQLAIAASGGVLMLRIARIVGIGMNADRTRTGWKTAALLLAGMTLSTAGIAYAAAFSDDEKDVRTAQKTRGDDDKAVQAKQKAQEKDTLNPVTRALKAAVRNGSMSEARAIQTYFLLTDGLRGSNMTEKTEKSNAYLDQVAAKLDAMVQTGELSAEDADAKMSAIEEQIASKQAFASSFRDELAAMMESGGKSETEAYLELAAERLDEIVMTGELSAEDAEARMIALEKRIAFGEELVGNDGKSKSEAYLKQVAAKLDAMVNSGALSAEEAEAKMIAIENAVAAKAKAKAGPRDARTVLMAVRRVDLKGDQEGKIRDIEREAKRAYSQIPRRDKQRHAELAVQVKAQITKLLDAEQSTRFESALEHLDRGSRRGAREQRRERGRQRDPKPREP